MRAVHTIVFPIPISSQMNPPRTVPPRPARLRSVDVSMREREGDRLLLVRAERDGRREKAARLGRLDRVDLLDRGERLVGREEERRAGGRRLLGELLVAQRVVGAHAHEFVVVRVGPAAERSQSEKCEEKLAGNRLVANVASSN